MAHPFVTEIREHDRVDAVFFAVRKTLLQARSGSPYLSLTLADRTGEIEGRVWEEADRIDQAFERGSYVRVRGVANTYGGRIQLKVDAVVKVDPDTISAADFIPSTRFDVETMWRELRELVDGVGDEQIRALLNAFLDDPEIGAPLKRSPAAKNVHHAFAGGLLEHTLSVMHLAHRVADHYPRANRDLLVAGALLHDIGKTAELTIEDGIDYTTEGRLVGHLVMTAQWITEKTAAIPGFPPALAMHLTHLVAAHHGDLDKGSPKVPQTLEAMIVHALDELDSRVQSWTSIMERDAGEEWTSYQRLYERFLYKRPGWGREHEGLPPAPEGQPWQGLSLYRREALGLIGKPGTTRKADGDRTAPAQGSRQRPVTRLKDVAEEPPVMPDLFSRTGTST
jgi:3'-5' exoribonuclease